MVFLQNRFKEHILRFEYLFFLEFQVRDTNIERVDQKQMMSSSAPQLVLGNTSLCHLITVHISYWNELSQKPMLGKVNKEALNIARRRGPGIDGNVAASVLRNHSGINRDECFSYDGKHCHGLASRLADILDEMHIISSIRFTRDDWMALLELCLSYEIEYLLFGRIDFTDWPPILMSIVSFMKIQGVPCLRSLCTRMIIREPLAYDMSPSLEDFVRTRYTGALVDASRISPHDPVSIRPTSVSCFLRLADYSSNWPYRLIRVCNKAVRIHQRATTRQGLGTGASVWGGAVTLCRVLEGRGAGTITGKSVVELGSGHGLCSLCCLLLDASLVISTDMPRNDGGLLQLIELNKHENIASLAACQRWEIAPLQWGDQAQIDHVREILGTRDRCDFILASECAYDESTFDELLLTIKALSNLETQIIMSHYPRTQGGCTLPEMREFEMRASDAGFVVNSSSITSDCGMTYEIHCMSINTNTASYHM
jgi:predicted nicotinamide N-methyase